LRRALALAEGVARSDAPLLLFGEQGTGRESLARYIHALPPVRAGDFVKIDCATADESEELGSPLSVILRCLAGGPSDAAGTLLLREIGDLPAEGQEAVARLIDPLDGRRPWRVIATSSRDLAVEVHRGTLKADLHAALSRITLYLPPLRQRRSDIPELVRHFLQQSPGVPDLPTRISDEALITLWRYDWPGNVAELEAVVHGLASLPERRVIRPSDLPRHILAHAESGGSPYREPMYGMRFRAAS
jgi:Nif-specific regulatory protein